MTHSFRFGKVVATRGVVAAVPPYRCFECLASHAKGDWGLVSEAQSRKNDLALVEGRRLFSAYAIDPTKTEDQILGNRLWIITTADRRATTLLLPEEY